MSLQLNEVFVKEPFESLNNLDYTQNEEELREEVEEGFRDGRFSKVEREAILSHLKNRKCAAPDDDHEKHYVK